MKLLTSSVYTFSDLIRDNFLYVDKTEYIWELVRIPKAMYFLSRPRRFGKSLTVSTLEAIFNGEKELFKGLSIYNKDYDWKKYPVIHLDFADRKNESPDALEESLQVKLSVCAEKHGVCLKTNNAQEQFAELIRRLGAQEKIVILIDEYDKPILDNIGKPEVAAIQDKLSNFYSVIKATEPFQRFVFMTGVSKFTHVSVFSELNNLTDITLNQRYGCIMGYTQEELETNFRDRIDRVAKQQDISRQELLDKLKQWYNGYCFHEKSVPVYNPVSIAQFFNNDGEFRNYWFDTGTPSFLLELAKKTNFDLEKALTEPVSGMAFKSYEIENLDTLALLVQTGYLTIKGTEQEFGKTFYRLGFPNLEVEEAFNTYLLSNYAMIPKEAVDSLSVNLAKLVRTGDVNAFMDLLSGLFKQIPYTIHVKNEKYYQTIFFTLFLSIGLHIEAESCINKGRIDAVASNGDWTYLLEFKLNKSAELALAQIKDREYFGKYLHTGKRIMMIGVNFDSQTGEITGWQKEELTP